LRVGTVRNRIELGHRRRRGGRWREGEAAPFVRRSGGDEIDPIAGERVGARSDDRDDGDLAAARIDLLAQVDEIARECVDGAGAGAPVEGVAVVRDLDGVFRADDRDRRGLSEIGAPTDDLVAGDRAGVGLGGGPPGDAVELFPAAAHHK
jgi:hypothetical protein